MIETGMDEAKRVKDDPNPVGRVFYGASTVIASVAQEVGLLEARP